MKLVSTRLAGVLVAETTPFADNRGAFSRFFCTEALGPALGNRRIEQINHSRTHTLGAIRGLHFQRSPHSEMKFIRCLRGRVWDVAVDLRRGSNTFLQWHAEELTSTNAKMFIIPEGCAHGFQVLDPESELLYLHTAPYTPSAEGGVSYNDPRLAIPWPLVATDLSSRDARHPPLTDAFQGI